MGNHAARILLGTGWPPGAIQDWLPTPAAETVEQKLRMLGHTGAVAVLGVVSHQGPVTVEKVIELTGLSPQLARTRLVELTAIGVLTYHPRTGPTHAMWDIDTNGMTRMGAYFIRARPPRPPADD